ncbi:MAG TPA: hypothetical protein VF867_03945 [Arthrobacter sp.]
MARPSLHDTGPLVLAIIDGRPGGWCDGIFDAPDDIKEHAIKMAGRGQEYKAGRSWVKCDDSTPLGATAALFHFAPGRTSLIQAPDDVRLAFSPLEVGLSRSEPEAN